MLRTIERTSHLLSLFTLESPEWGITELATALNWNTSSTHDLAASLVEIGLLRKSGNRRYKMGWRVLELSHIVLGSSHLQVEARKAMEAFTHKHDETIWLGILGGGRVLIADKIASKSFEASVFSTPGGRLHAHCTAAGKVLMAHLSAESRQLIIDEHGLKPITPKSIQSIATLNEELERVKEQGHAYTFEESALGFGSVAAPVFDYSGQVVASLSIKAPIQRFERHLDEYRSAIVRTANQVSRGLGHLIFSE